MEIIADSLKAYWFLIAVALLALIITGFIVKKILKILLIVICIGLVLLFIFYRKDSGKIISNTAQEVSDFAFKSIKPVIEKELSQAKFSEKPDGSYELKTASVRLTARKGATSGKLYFNNREFTVDIAPFLKIVEKARSDAKK